MSRHFIHCVLYFFCDTAHFFLWHGASRNTYAHFQRYSENEILVEQVADRLRICCRNGEEETALIGECGKSALCRFLHKDIAAFLHEVIECIPFRLV